MVREKIEDIIYEVRGEKVILVRDLANICNIETRTINQLIKRNIDMFSSDDYFELSDEEFNDWKSQIVTSNQDKMGLRKLPYCLTLHGIKTLSKILKNKEIINFMSNENSYELVRSNNEIFPKNQRKIENLIYEINGTQIMLDSDLALLYEVETKRINEAVKNNPEKFPNRFSWILSQDEIYNLRSKFSTSSLEKTHGGRRYNIRVFSEQGVAMLSTILKSNVATEVSIQIMDAFVYMRHYIGYNYNNLINDYNNIKNKINMQDEKILIQEKKIENQNEKLLEHDKKFDKLFSNFDKKEKSQMLFLNGESYDAHSKMVSIMSKSNKKLVIIDAFSDGLTLDILSDLNKIKKLSVIIITRPNKNLKTSDIAIYNKQYNNLTIKYNDEIHDRYIIIDDKEIYLLSSSLNYNGRGTFCIIKITDKEVKKVILNEYKKMLITK